MTIDRALQEKFLKIKAFAFDVDGVLTDGGILADLNGELYRTFDSKDGMGLRMAMMKGFHLAIITGGEHYPPLVLGAIALVCVGVIGLGIVEAREDDELRAARQEVGNFKYTKSWLALALPIAYCILDAAGTFADSVVLGQIEGIVAAAGVESDYEASANVAYELTFLISGIVSFVYAVIIKKQKLVAKMEAPKYVGAAFETAGQFAYIYAIADEEHLAMSAPIISAYCVASVLWSRIFLKEKLSRKHYLMVLLVVIGIVIMGVFDV